ncbi:MAG: CinA family protein [Alphaproteobacteria bacterium]|nr:CinA family protein [Alphaproteobacteria bacterium]
MKDAVENLSHILREKQLCLACAESCTGGMIAVAITDIPGSSDIFDRGFVTYSNAAKIDSLDVSPATLERFGAVSQETASEMVLGALANSVAQIAVAVTGVAGPGGGTAEKPVGLVYVAVCARGKAPEIVRCHFDGDRSQVRQLTCSKAFDFLIEVANVI